MKAKSRKLIKAVSIIVLIFFSWTFGGVFEIAQAISNSTEGQKSRSAEVKTKITPPGLPLPQGEGKKPEEQFQKTIEDIDSIIYDQMSAFGDQQKTNENKKKLRGKKTEIESLDIEIKKQFTETEGKIKDLPEVIKQRHRDFVKKYAENLNELRAKLDAIDKAKDQAELKAEVEKTDAFLEKVKPPKKHQKLDPNKLPNRTEEPVFKEPRTKPEEFLNNSQKSVVKSQKVKPILLAMNGEATGLLSSPIPEIQNSDPMLLAATDSLPSGSYQIALANPPTDADLAETIEVQFTPELQEIANLLEHNPVLLYEFVRNNFEYEPYHGSVKGSQSTLLLQSGNDFDQASSLIALMRVSGIPARYVYGTVEIPIEKVMKWVGGATNPNVAAQILATGGIPGKLITEGGQIKYAQMEHVWIEAYLPYGNYRGIINDPNAPRTWIPLDPSFKLYDPNPNATDLAELQGFNIDDYFATYLQSIKPKTPAKDYLKTTIDNVDTNLPGQSFYDLLATAPIIDKTLDYLPDTLPYPVIVAGEKFSTIPEIYRHKITVELTDANYYETLLSYTASWSALLHNRVTLSYIPASASDEATMARYGGIYSTPSYLIQVKPVLSVEGTAVATGGAVNMASDIVCQMNIDGLGGKRNLIINTLTVGATHAIGLGSGTTNGRIITYRTAKLDAAVTAGESGEPILGEYLNLLALNYLQELDSSRKMIAGTMKILDKNAMSELMVGVDLGVTYLYGAPLNVVINGLTIDADYIASAAFDMGGDQTKVRRYRILTGVTSSALEHTVFEAITGGEAISAVKALQLANEQGIPIHRIDLSNISEKLHLLQLSNEVKADIQNCVAAGKVITVSERNVQLNNWNGVGYIVLDPNKGTGGYMISGGLSGGSLTAVTAYLKSLISSGKMTKEEAKQYILSHRSQIWFIAPAEGSIISKFGKRGTGFHKGIDLSVSNWTTVLSVAKGIVHVHNDPIGYGKAVYIDHGAGVETRYGHNCEILVRDGEEVVDGQEIAKSGNTGGVRSNNRPLPSDYPRCSKDPDFQKGSHVHFEIRLLGQPIDPETFKKFIDN